MLENVYDIAEREKERKLGFERIELLPGSTFKDASLVVVVPTRGMIHAKVVAAWDALGFPMNDRRAKIYAVGEEVGVAYNKMIEQVLRDPVLSTFRYVLTMEDDNLPPRRGVFQLLEAIEVGPFDVAAGLYYTKGDVNMPMAYGDPHEFARSGRMDFRPRNVVEALRTGTLCEVNGVAMGFTLWRMSVFKEFPPPWFVTVNEVGDGKSMTQDLYFCERLRRAGKRLCVDLRVHVGHMDVTDGTVY